PICARIGQGTEEGRIRKPKNSGVRSDPNGESEDCHATDGWSFFSCAKRILQVLPYIPHQDNVLFISGTTCAFSLETTTCRKDANGIASVGILPPDFERAYGQNYVAMIRPLRGEQPVL
ncbi:MAG TPA: hypothetical protein VGK01_07170, partial [Candidatus Angelobacter sp.]